MIDFKEACDIIYKSAKNFGTEWLSLEDADGRVLAEDVFADRDYPPFNRSAMDGYALKTDDWEQGIRKFGIQQVLFAGMKPDSALKFGFCYKIMTGASVPKDANAVIRREDAEESEGKVSFALHNINLYQNIARQGEDLKKGEIAIQSNTSCTPAVISTIAALGKTGIKVWKLPKIALFTTGDEVKPITDTVTDTQIRNSNEWLVKTLLNKWNIKPSLYKHIPDNIKELEDCITQALEFDMLITCGGVSAGDADYMPQVFKSAGIKKLFHKVAIKPGKPIFCGQMPKGGMVFALPGNPFSTMVTFKLFVETYLYQSINRRTVKTYYLPFVGNRIKKTSMDEFFPVQIKGRPSSLSMIKINGSGDIRLGLYADGIAHHPKEADELKPGTFLEFYSI